MKRLAWPILPIVLFASIIVANVSLFRAATSEPVVLVTETPAPAPAEPAEPVAATVATGAPGDGAAMLLLAVFVASLVGSLHCAGMCGGLVAMCMPVGDEPTGPRWLPHAAYHFGRLVTYAGLGAVSGALGAAIDLGGSLVGLSRVAAFAAGGAMIVVGLGALARARGLRFGALPLPRRLETIVQRGIRAAYRRRPGTRGLLIGLITGFLPCGWLYAFVITAAGTGGAVAGAATMAVFWAGTVPVLLVLAFGLQGITGPLRRHVPTATAVLLVVVGLVTVFGRLNLPAYADAPVPEATSEIERVRHLAETPPPCCRDHP